MCKLSRKLGMDKPSPSDILKEGYGALFLTDGVRLLKGGPYHVVKRELLNIPFECDPRLWICTIPDTNSMDPVFDSEHINLYIQGFGKTDQKIMVDWLVNEWFYKKSANILVYRTNGVGSTSVVHRLKDIKYGKDNLTRIWTFRGDNNRRDDPWKAGDADIQWLLIGTIY